MIGWDNVGVWIASHPKLVAKHLDRYFASDAETFLGKYYEPLAANASSERFDGYDLAALWSLSVSVKPKGRQQLLHGKAAELTQLLQECAAAIEPKPVDAPLAPSEIDVLTAADSPFNQLWDLLMTIHDVGETKASKLMAARFPRHIPIWDKHVRTLLGGRRKGRFWRPMHELLAEQVQDDEQTVSTLLGRPAIDLLKTVDQGTSLLNALTDVSLLRRLDVVLWMEAQA